MHQLDYPPGTFPGAFDITNEQYHGDTRFISKSGIGELMRSPAHYHWKYLDPTNDKRTAVKDDNLDFGSLFHTALLQPNLLDLDYVVMPSYNLRTNKGKEDRDDFLLANSDKKICTQPDLDLARRMQDSVFKHPAAKQLLANGHVEQSFFYEDVDTVAPCKIRPDFINDMGLLVDPKSTKDGSPINFGRDAANYHYDIQAAMNMDGIKEASGITPRGFVLIAVEKEPPFAVACYAPRNNALESARATYKEKLMLYNACRQSDNWPAYSDKVEPLAIPKWAIREIVPNFELFKQV